jgi:hypothetical protein
MYDKTQITFEVFKSLRHGYEHTHLVIREMYVEDTATHLEGTVDNKAGYGSPAYAQAAARKFQSLLDAGHTQYFDHTSSGLVPHLRWQHFEIVEGKRTYCAVAYDDLGRSFGQIEKALGFLRKLARRIEKVRYGEIRGSNTDNFLSDPEEVLSVLGRMKKATKVRLDSTSNLWVQD